MSTLELLKKQLIEAKEKLEAKGFVLGEEGEFMDLIPSMKQYEYAFQNVIENVFPDKSWWQVTNYWDIFQNSIMPGKTADEVIEDILQHINIEEEKQEESLEEDRDIKVKEEILALFNKGE